MDADAAKVDAARQFVARVHGKTASVVDYDGNGFCWGWSLLGSAFPHALEHGALVAAGESTGSIAVKATPADLRLEIHARRQIWKSRTEARYKRTVNNASRTGVGAADNDFYAARGLQARVQSYGGWCGSSALIIMADMIGLDYVVMFDAVQNTHTRTMTLMITAVRAAGELQEYVEGEAPIEKSLRGLRAQGKTRGAYVVHVPNHYLAVQVGAFAPPGTGTARRPRPGVTLGDESNAFLVDLQAAHRGEVPREAAGTSGVVSPDAQDR